jgi:hypothetical protein
MNTTNWQSKQADRALAEYLRGGETLHFVVADLIGDLRCLCDDNGIVFSEVVDLADGFYRAGIERRDKQWRAASAKDAQLG